ncbi:hypothetical protein NPIL_570071 [Nephila pilipes]|uniref:Uncharacterized protein n=1 Tax=Nephila pilipes TaxID=299642 RepID=A0A8X6PQC1_NEPPI|nr:hypothetical protein NPIL_570071 [Nephila pilipes]
MFWIVQVLSLESYYSGLQEVQIQSGTQKPVGLKSGLLFPDELDKGVEYFGYQGECPLHSPPRDCPVTWELVMPNFDHSSLILD